MKKEFKQLKTIKLSESEKMELFGRISKNIASNANGVTFKYPIKSPFMEFFSFSHRYVKIAVLATVVLLAGSATTFASLRALPGDLLYGVKVGIVEKAQGFLKITPESRLEDNSTKIEIRVHELETLIKRGKLTEEKAKNIEKNINKNLDAIDSDIREIKNKNRESDKKEVEAKIDLNINEEVEKIQRIKEREKVLEKDTLQSVIDRVEKRNRESRYDVPEEKPKICAQGVCF